VIQTPAIQWSAIAPVIVLLGLACLLLLLGSVVSGAKARVLSGIITIGGLIATALISGWLWHHHHDWLVLSGQLRVDRFTDFVTILVCAAGVATVGISWGTHRLDERTSEYHALLLSAVAGMSLLAASNSLLVLFVALELFSISLYVLCALDVWSEASLESGLKYLVIGSVGSAFLLFGSGLVYASTQKLRFDEIATAIQANDLGGQAILLFGIAMILGGLAFKASAAPFHQWTPDVYEGAPTPVTAFMSAATKAVALVLTLRVLTVAFPELDELWTVALAVIACISLAVGNLAALVQRRVKRLLAYSSISHAGFLLIAVAAANELGGRALLYYLIPYCAASLGAFAVVAARERELNAPVTLDNLAGLGWERPLLGVAMWSFMLSFAGFPLTGGFVGKFYVFSAAYDRGWTWLVIFGVAATFVSLYYYLAVIRAMYMRPASELTLAPAGGSPPREVLLSTAVLAAMVVNVGAFFAVQPLIGLAKDAAESLPL
jgi:NADH-quinone oxidoreductase subunit N